MSHKDLLILVFCAVALQQQFLAALAGEQKSAVEPIMLADLSYGPYRADVTPISSFGKSSNPHEFATKLNLIIAQSDFEKNYSSYGQQPISIGNLDKSEDPQVFQNELNKIVAQSDFEKHLVNKGGSNEFVPAKKLPQEDHRPANISEDMKSHPTKYHMP